MKIALAREHRKTLETVIAQARVAAESGAAKALQALAVGAKEVPAHFTDAQKKPASAMLFSSTCNTTAPPLPISERIPGRWNCG